MKPWSQGHTCKSRIHCTSCPYVLEWNDTLAGATACHRSIERQLIKGWNIEPSGRCPHGVTLKDAITLRARHRQAATRDNEGRFVRRILRWALRQPSAPSAAKQVVEAIKDRSLPLWLPVSVIREAQTDGLSADGGHIPFIAQPGAAALLAGEGNDVAYWAVRECVVAGALSAEEALGVCEAVGIKEPAYV